MTSRVSRATMLSALGASSLLGAIPRLAYAADLQTVNLASAFQDDIAPVLYGVSSGIFARRGLDVHVQPATSGGAAAAAVAGGALQFAKSGPISLIAGHAHGVGFTVIAPSRISTPERPLGHLLVRADSPIKTAKDCNGKIFAGSALNDFNALVALQWVDLNGGDWHSIKLVEIPASSVIPALVDNRIDAATAEDPVRYDALASGKIRALANPFDSVGKRYIASCWFTSKDLVAKQPDLVRRFVAGLREATVYASAHPAEMASSLAPFLHDDPAKLQKMGLSQLGVTLDARELQPVVDIAVKFGIIDKSFDARDLVTILS
jgi:NitT/TauT family transport system substrate-binding protein